MQRYRNKQRNEITSVTGDSVTGKDKALRPDVTADGTYFKDGVEMVPALGSLPERPRYLKLSDGQVLDRANPPKGKPWWKVESLRRCNRANETVIDPVRAERYRRWKEGIKESPVAGNLIDNRKDLEAIVQSLKDRKQLDNVSLGVMPMAVVADLLECTAK